MRELFKHLWWLIADFWMKHNCPICDNETSNFDWVTHCGSGIERKIPVRVYTCKKCWDDLYKID